MSPVRPLICFLSVMVLSGALAGPPARSLSSLSDLDLETAETRLTLEKTLRENKRLLGENVQLEERLAISEASAGRLSSSLALAKDEANLLQQRLNEQKVRLEALGLGAGAGSQGKLEQRLLEAVNNYGHSEEERKKLADHLGSLIEAVAGFAKLAEGADPAARLALEARLRQGRELLGTASPNAVEGAAAPATLSDGMIISIKDELGLVVANLGQKQGVAVGMPFQVIRNDRLVGTVRVVDVRDRIAGAVIQDLSSEKEKIKVGDRLKVAARQ